MVRATIVILFQTVLLVSFSASATECGAVWCLFDETKATPHISASTSKGRAWSMILAESDDSAISFLETNSNSRQCNSPEGLSIFGSNQDIQVSLTLQSHGDPLWMTGFLTKISNGKSEIRPVKCKTYSTD